MARTNRKSGVLAFAARAFFILALVLFVANAPKATGMAATVLQEEQHEWNEWVDDLLQFMSGPPRWRAATFFLTLDTKDVG